MADIGSRVDIYREEIKHCIVNDMVLSSLRGIIDPGKDTNFFSIDPVIPKMWFCQVYVTLGPCKDSTSCY